MKLQLKKYVFLIGKLQERLNLNQIQAVEDLGDRGKDLHQYF